MSNKHFIKTEINDSDNLAIQNKAVVVLTAVTFVLVAFIYLEVKDIPKEPQTVIQFPSIEDTAVVGWENANDGYLLMAANYVATNYFQVSPSNVDFQFSLILKLAHPTVFPAMQKRLAEEKEIVQSLKTISFLGGIDLSQKFIVETNLVNKEYFGVGKIARLKFAVTRTPVSTSVNSAATPTERKSMSIIYTIEKGRFYLVDMYLEQLQND